MCLACSHSCACAMFLHFFFFHRCGEVAIFYHLCVCAAVIGFLLLMFFFCFCVCSTIVIFFLPIFACILPSLCLSSHCTLSHHCSLWCNHHGWQDVRNQFPSFFPSITVCILPSLHCSMFQPVLSAVQASCPASGTDPTFLDGAGWRGVRGRQGVAAGSCEWPVFFVFVF